MNAISAEGLSKVYAEGTVAVDKISFSLDKGEIFGFLGPNGSGKTTTVKLLCGMLVPSDGNCQVLGLDPIQNPEQQHKNVGVVTEHAQMYDHMTAMENLQFYGTLFGMSPSECAERARVLLQQLELADVMDRRLGTYSTGMRQRLSLARALLHSPQILFLDEPTSGLDPESSRNVNSLIQEQAAEGTTVFLCTHQLRYAQEICTTYGLMNKGHLFAAGNITELRSMVRRNTKVRVKSCYLIDSGVYGSEAQIARYMKRIGRDISEVKAVFLTHAHPDHIGTAAWFREHTGCRIYASRGERDWIEDIDLKYQERREISCAVR